MKAIKGIKVFEIFVGEWIAARSLEEAIGYDVLNHQGSWQAYVDAIELSDAAIVENFHRGDDDAPRKKPITFKAELQRLTKSKKTKFPRAFASDC